MARTRSRKARTESQRRQAVIYARVSSKEQELEGFSISAQLKLMREYARTRDFEVVKEFVYAETAKRPGRSEFGKMVSFLKKSKWCRTILVEKTDRLYRNLKDYVTLDELDLEIHLVKDNDVMSQASKSNEKFVHGIKVLMAKNYIDNLSEETKKGMTEKAEQGMWPSHAPIGYRNVVGPNGKKIIEADPHAASLIHKVYEAYARGNVSIHQVTEMAREAGLLNPRTKRTIPRATIYNVLQNLIYTGDFEWNGVTYKGTHTPLITRALFDKVQQMLRRHKSKRTRRSKRKFAFAGLLTCGHCGCALVGEIKKQKYIYYHCTGHKGKCGEPYVREEVLEEHFGNSLKRLQFDSEVLELVTRALRESHEDEKRVHNEALARLQAEYSKLQNRIDQAYDDKVDGVIESAFYKRKTAEWRAEQQRILESIEQHQTANEGYLDDGVRLLELARRAYDLFMSQPAEEKRRLLDFVFSNCSWKAGKLTAQFRQPFDILADASEAHKQKEAAGASSDGLRQDWLPELDSNQQPSG